MFVGGSIRGNRLAGLEYKSVLGEDVPAKVRTFLEAFKAERKSGEIFADWFARTRTKGAAELLGPRPSNSTSNSPNATSSDQRDKE
jgi:sulfite reductase beta subunit-like hemoprotein